MPPLSFRHSPNPTKILVRSQSPRPLPRVTLHATNQGAKFVSTSVLHSLWPTPSSRHYPQMIPCDFANIVCKLFFVGQMHWRQLYGETKMKFPLRLKTDNIYNSSVKILSAELFSSHGHTVLNLHICMWKCNFKNDEKRKAEECRLIINSHTSGLGRNLDWVCVVGCVYCLLHYSGLCGRDRTSKISDHVFSFTFCWY